MTTLITGTASFFGSHVALRLLAHADRVVSLEKRSDLTAVR